MVTSVWLLLLATLLSESLRCEAKTWDVIVMKDVRVPMRDGVKLATDLYIPAENGYPVSKKIPALLLRIPYNKES